VLHAAGVIQTCVYPFSVIGYKFAPLEYGLMFAGTPGFPFRVYAAIIKIFFRVLSGHINNISFRIYSALQACYNLCISL
jgi:hypothetical protein